MLVRTLGIIVKREGLTDTELRVIITSWVNREWPPHRLREGCVPAPGVDNHRRSRSQSGVQDASSGTRFQYRAIIRYFALTISLLFYEFYTVSATETELPRGRCVEGAVVEG